MIRKLSGEMKNRFVKSHKNKIFVHRQAKQVRIRNLFMPKETLEKTTAERGPSKRNRLVMIAQFFRQPCEHGRCFLHAQVTDLWSCHMAE